MTLKRDSRKIAIVLAIATLPRLLAQSASSPQGLMTELADKLAARLTPSEPISVQMTPRDAAGTADSAEARDALVAALRAKRIRVVDSSDSAARVDVSCGTNLREKSCVAEIRRGAARDVVAVSRPHSTRPESRSAAPLSLEWRPVFAQRDPILDIALAADRLLVLQPDAVVSYQRRDAGWELTQARPVPQARPWPRDLRGRMWIEGTGVEVRLPGVTCRAALDLANLTCAEERQPWPIGIENAGLDATRNNFATPEGLPFFGAAAVGGSGDVRWLIADRSGLVTLLDGARRAVATAGPGDDVAAIVAPCASGPHVLVASPSDRRAETDTLRLLQLVGHRLLPAAAPVDARAVVTALWSTADPAVATTVVRDADGERYEAVHIRIACDR